MRLTMENPEFLQSRTAAGLNSIHENKRAEVVVRSALGAYAGQIAVVSSFGVDSAVLLHMVSEIDKNTPVIFLETGFHFDETLQYQEMLASQLGLRDIRKSHPPSSALAELDPHKQLHRVNSDACCALRKNSVLKEALSPFRAWMSGRKRYQTMQRRDMLQFETDSEGRTKVNPLADWSAEDLSHYLEANGLPRHPLWSLGYRSIGCAPCTALPNNAADPRSGRWSGCGKTECGIHL